MLPEDFLKGEPLNSLIAWYYGNQRTAKIDTHSPVKVVLIDLECSSHPSELDILPS